MYSVMTMPTNAQTLNNRTYTDYYYRLMLKAKAVFKWTGLPEGINEKHIEKYLFTDGSCMLYKDDVLGFIVSRCTKTGFNYYDEPTKLRPYAANLIKTDEKENNVNAVLIQNNDDSIPTSHTIRMYAYRLTQIQRAIDTNIELQKMPYILKGTEKVKNSLKQIMRQKADNEPAIFVDKDLELLGKIEVLKTDAPFIIDKLQIAKSKVWNECMTYLGINNSNMEKRERLVASEVDANDEQIEVAAHVMLKARQDACKKINDMFGLNISVELRASSNKVKEVTEDGEEDV